MVQEVTIPLSSLNSILFGDPLEDVVFRVPELEDIVDAVVSNTLDKTDLDEALGDFVDEVADQIQQATIDTDQLVQDILEEVETQVSDLVIDAQDVADLVVEQLNLEDLVTDQVNISGIFGPLTDDVVQAFEEILNEVLGAIEDLPEDLTDVSSALTQIITDTTEILERLPTDLQATVEDGVGAVLEDLGLGPFLEDPVTWFLDRLEEFVQERIEPETQQAVEEATFLEPPP